MHIRTLKLFLRRESSNPITAANFNGVSYTREMKLHKYLDAQHEGYRNDKGKGRGPCRITNMLGLILHIGEGRRGEVTLRITYKVSSLQASVSSY